MLDVKSNEPFAIQAKKKRRLEITMITRGNIGTYTLYTPFWLRAGPRFPARNPVVKSRADRATTRERESVRLQYFRTNALVSADYTTYHTVRKYTYESTKVRIVVQYHKPAGYK